MEVIRRGAAAFETDWMFIIVTNDFSNVSALLFEVIKSEVFEAEVFEREGDVVFLTRCGCTHS
jgi:hypothetical protein